MSHMQAECIKTGSPWSMAELRIRADQDIIWQYMKPRGRPSFTFSLMQDMNALADFLALDYCRNGVPLAQFVVTASAIPGIFSLGGDLDLFITAVKARNEPLLRRYAHTTAAGQHRLYTAFSTPMTMVAFVQGDALGGGFEAALAHDLIVAERGTKFGLPEVLFDLFPGMGAYSFLSRRLGVVAAERMILSGQIYLAEELHAMGVVDALVDKGAGEAAVRKYLTSTVTKSLLAVLKARKVVNPVSLDELIKVSDIWVDSALQLGPRDLRRMEYLVKAQNRRMDAGI